MSRFSSIAICWNCGERPAGYYVRATIGYGRMGRIFIPCCQECEPAVKQDPRGVAKKNDARVLALWSRAVNNVCPPVTE